MLSVGGTLPDGYVDGLVQTGGELAQVAIPGHRPVIRHVQVRKHAVHVHACLLAWNTQGVTSTLLYGFSSSLPEEVSLTIFQ